MSDSICRAIRERKVIRFVYDDDWRVVEPHACGVDSNGHAALRGYQVNLPGPDDKRKWRLFHVDKIRSLTVAEDPFAGPRDGYKRGDKAFAHIYCEL